MPVMIYRLGMQTLIHGDSTDRQVLALLPNVDCCVFDPDFDSDEYIRPEQRNVLAFTDARYFRRTIELLGPPRWVFTWDCCYCRFLTQHAPLQRAKYCLWYGDRPYHMGRTKQGPPMKPIRAKKRWGQGYLLYPADPDGARLSDVYRQPISQIEYKHSKPLEWMRALIGGCFDAPFIDQYCGYGTSLLAAEQLGIEAVGIEIDPDRVQIAVKRFRELFPDREVQRVDSL